MTKLDDTVQAFTRDIGEFLLDMQTIRKFDADKFSIIKENANRIAVLIKDDKLVSKALLNEFRTAVRILRAESDTSSQRDKLSESADQLEMIFDLILMGESVDDRKPGVPRIL